MTGSRLAFGRHPILIIPVWGHPRSQTRTATTVVVVWLSLALQGREPGNQYNDMTLLLYVQIVHVMYRHASQTHALHSKPLQCAVVSLILQPYSVTTFNFFRSLSIYVTLHFPGPMWC